MVEIRAVYAAVFLCIFIMATFQSALAWSPFKWLNKHKKQIACTSAGAAAAAAVLRFRPNVEAAKYAYMGTYYFCMNNA